MIMYIYIYVYTYDVQYWILVGDTMANGVPKAFLSKIMVKTG